MNVVAVDAAVAVADTDAADVADRERVAVVDRYSNFHCYR